MALWKNRKDLTGSPARCFPAASSKSTPAINCEHATSRWIKWSNLTCLVIVRGLEYLWRWLTSDSALGGVGVQVHLSFFCSYSGGKPWVLAWRRCWTNRSKTKSWFLEFSSCSISFDWFDVQCERSGQLNMTRTSQFRVSRFVPATSTKAMNILLRLIRIIYRKDVWGKVLVMILSFCTGASRSSRAKRDVYCSWKVDPPITRTCCICGFDAHPEIVTMLPELIATGIHRCSGKYRKC